MTLWEEFTTGQHDIRRANISGGNVTFQDAPVPIGAAQAAGAGAEYTSTLREQARRIQRRAHMQHEKTDFFLISRSAQAPWCGALPTVRGLHNN